MIKSFKGKLADGGQDRIRLSTIRGKVGYQIIKFELLPAAPGTTDYESVVKIYKIEQTSITGSIDFTEPNLLAAAYIEGTGQPAYADQATIIFDNELVNQDVYISHNDADSSTAVNYYIEMEQRDLTDQGAEYTTLKDLRSTSR